MLPFLKLKKQPVAGLIMKRRAPDSSEASKQETPEQTDAAAIETCMYAMMNAFAAGDTVAASKAFKDAHDILHGWSGEESEEKQEDSDSSSLNSYKSQNIKAAAHGEEF